MACGAVISAPAVMLSVVLGLDVTTTCLLMGMPTAIYTMFGGVQAVTWTDVKQMFLIVAGLFAAFGMLLISLPDTVGVADALRIAGATGRVQTFDFRFDLTDRYTFWSARSRRCFCSCPTSAPIRARCSVISRRARSTRRGSRSS